MRTQYPEPSRIPDCYTIYKSMGQMARPVIRRINTFHEKYDLGSLEAYLYGVIAVMQAPEGIYCDADIEFFSWFAQERPKKIEVALGNLIDKDIILYTENDHKQMCFVVMERVISPLDSILDICIPKKNEGHQCSCKSKKHLKQT